jgi:hypothetical protein
MDKKPRAGSKGAHCPLPEPIVLPLQEAQQVAGGINPQPLPPGAEHRVEAE